MSGPRRRCSPATRIPTGIALALVRPGDQGFAWLDPRLPSLQAHGRGGFVTIDDAELLNAETWTPESAVWQLIDALTRGLSEIVQDVVASGEMGEVPRIGLRSIDRTGTTREAVEKLSRLRAAIGLGGETLVDAMLERMRSAGLLLSHEWVAASNATAPVDFRAQSASSTLSIEVKTTKGSHDRAFIISTSELQEARKVASYEIWRLSDFVARDEELKATVRKADPTATVEQALSWLETAPEGIRVPSVEMSPTSLTWSEPQSATCPASRVPSDQWSSDIDLGTS